MEKYCFGHQGKVNGSEMRKVQAIVPLKQALTVCVEGLTKEAKPLCRD
jgi:hypothetical protein